MKSTALGNGELMRHLAGARLLALSSMPYLAAVLTSMRFFEQEGLGTVGVDGHLRVYVDPITISGWSTKELAGALLHEANHFIRQHHVRAPYGVWFAKRFNIAGDLEINDDLRAAGVPLPNGGLFPEQFGFDPGHTAEHYFEALKDVVTDDVVCSCGSGATGVPLPHELGDDGTTLDESRRRAILDATSTAIESSGPGLVPAGLSRWAKARKSEVPWDRILRQHIRHGITRGSGQVNYSWSTPNRRIQGRVILPRLRGVAAQVLCIVDTSASMSQDLLDKATSEVKSVCQQASVSDVHLISCDAKATYHGRISTVENLRLIGGGGTHLEDCLKLIKSNKLNPSIVIFLTDGFTTWSDELPTELEKRKVIVVIPRGNPPGPSWAETVEMWTP
jgi:predicted metal-dependent peptidase